MNTATIPHPIHLTIQHLLETESAAFSKIPGMDKLLHAAPGSIPELGKKYPDAAFALMIAENLFVGDQEQNVIHQRAYTAILKGEPIANIRFKYDYDLESYLLKHMWD